MRTYQQRKKKEPKRSSKLFGFIYFLVLVVVAYFLASLVMQQVDLYDLLGLYRTRIPVINVPGTDIPEWAFKVVLALIILFILQLVSVLVVGFFKGGKRELEP
jgi:uncharacterized membrane protein